MRRPLAAMLAALLAAGLLPLTAAAAGPVPSTDKVATAEDTPITVTLRATDPDGDPIAFEVVGPPANGSLGAVDVPACDVVPDECTAEVRYTPDPDWWGEDAFTFTATSAGDAPVEATIGLTVAPVNDAPSFTPGIDPVSVDEDSGAYGATWATDIDPGPGEGGQAVTFDVVADLPALFATQPGIDAAGVLTFRPSPDWWGTATLTVTAHDNGGMEDYGIPGVTPADTAAPVTFAITVRPVNDAPAPQPGSVDVPEDTAWLIALRAVDIEGDPTTSVAIASQPAHGTIGVGPTIDCDGRTPNACVAAAIYTPDPGYNGPDGFTFTVTDGTTASAPAAVTIDVTPVGDAPTCSGPYGSTGAEDAVQSGSLACTDVDSGSLAYALAEPAVHGTATVAADGAWTYVPPANWSGSDSFTFTASDGTNVSGEATVPIVVTPVNDPPVCAPSPVAAGDEDATLDGMLACTDIEGTALSYALVSPAAHGTVDLAPDGGWSYRPAANWSGADGFKFAASDGVLSSGPQPVAIAVHEVNDPPLARTDGATIAATATSTIPVIAGNPSTGAGHDLAGPLVGGAPSEPDDTIRVTSVTQGLKGFVSIAPGGGAVVYDPRGCATGGDTFSYTITDSHGLTATAGVIVTIARPGTSGLSGSPITDAPTLGFITGSTIGRTVPARLAWCGVTRSGTSPRSYRISESRNGGASYPANLVMSTRSTSSTRSLSVNVGYRWQIRTVDTTGRAGAWRASAAARVARYQESSAALVYSPTGWATSSATSASGGATRRASSPGAWVRLTVTDARQVAIVGPRSSTRGSLRVYVDGAPVATLSERSATTGWRRVLYVRSLSSGPGVSHTIELRPVGDGRIDLDAILVLR